MPQSSVEANIAARSAGNSEFCDIARRMPGIAIEMKAPAIPTRMVAVKPATKEYLISPDLAPPSTFPIIRSEEHTSELQSLMRSSYAVFCLQKTNQKRSQSSKSNHTPPRYYY